VPEKEAKKYYFKKAMEITKIKKLPAISARHRKLSDEDDDNRPRTGSLSLAEIIRRDGKITLKKLYQRTTTRGNGDEDEEDDEEEEEEEDDDDDEEERRDDFVPDLLKPADCKRMVNEMELDKRIWLFEEPDDESNIELELVKKGESISSVLATRTNRTVTNTKKSGKPFDNIVKEEEQEEEEEEEEEEEKPKDKKAAPAEEEGAGDDE